MTVKHRFTASDGAGIAYTDEGKGMPLLCLSGLTRNGSDFDYMLPHLPPGWRVIRMDYRGRGASDWTGAATYTVPREGKDAVELLDHLGIARAAVLGTSRGGLIGMFLAATARDRLAAEDKVFVREGDRCWFVEVKAIRLLESEGNYTRVHFAEAQPQLFRSLNAMEERLDPKYFFRANRRQIVNLAWIDRIEPWFSGGLLVHLKGGAQVELSRRQAQDFRERMSL